MFELGIHIDGLPRAYPRFEALFDPDKEIKNADNQYVNMKGKNTGVTPFVESNFLEVLIPSFLGAEIHAAPGGYMDVRPIFKDIYETEKIKEIDIFSGEMERAIKHHEYIKKNAPDYLYVNPTRIMSPLDYGVVLMGSEFYSSLIEEPELCCELMEKLTDAAISALLELKKVVGQPKNETITPQGYIYEGIRLTGDAVVNLSPNMIKDLICPFYKKFKAAFGNVMLHYCTRPANSTHVIKALCEGGGVDWVDNNWHGIDSLLTSGDYEKTECMNACVSMTNEEILGGEMQKHPFLNTKRQVIVSTRCKNMAEAELLMKGAGS